MRPRVETAMPSAAMRERAAKERRRVEALSSRVARRRAPPQFVEPMWRSASRPARARGGSGRRAQLSEPSAVRGRRESPCPSRRSSAARPLRRRKTQRQSPSTWRARSGGSSTTRRPRRRRRRVRAALRARASAARPRCRSRCRGRPANTRSVQRTELHTAVCAKDVARATALCADGRGVDVEDEHGFTPLHNARGARRRGGRAARDAAAREARRRPPKGQRAIHLPALGECDQQHRDGRAAPRRRKPHGRALGDRARRRSTAPHASAAPSARARDCPAAAARGRRRRLRRHHAQRRVRRRRGRRRRRRGGGRQATSAPQPRPASPPAAPCSRPSRTRGRSSSTTRSARCTSPETTTRSTPNASTRFWRSSASARGRRGRAATRGSHRGSSGGGVYELPASEVIESSEFDPAPLEALRRVHAPAYVDIVASISKSNAEQAAGGVAASPVPFTPLVQKAAHNMPTRELKDGRRSDTRLSAGSYAAARRAAGAVIAAVDTVLAGKARNALCIVRPPGHHAGTRGLIPGSVSCGFCVFNSAMVARRTAAPAAAAAARARAPSPPPPPTPHPAGSGQSGLQSASLRPPPPTCASAAWPSSILTCTTATAPRRLCER